MTRSELLQTLLEVGGVTRSWLDERYPDWRPVMADLNALGIIHCVDKVYSVSRLNGYPWHLLPEGSVHAL